MIKAIIKLIYTGIQKLIKTNYDTIFMKWSLQQKAYHVNGKTAVTPLLTLLSYCSTKPLM